ncbi:hypothetical protein EJ110_NYTH55548 [Nymphaea thermarum]|nr:hypothetical protein EJ110_NYTH55548 [Nymphaea thermarum]
MDFVGYSKERFDSINMQLGGFLRSCGFKESHISWVPTSVMENQNLVAAITEPRFSWCVTNREDWSVEDAEMIQLWFSPETAAGQVLLPRTVAVDSNVRIRRIWARFLFVGMSGMPRNHQKSESASDMGGSGRATGTVHAAVADFAD